MKTYEIEIVAKYKVRYLADSELEAVINAEEDFIQLNTESNNGDVNYSWCVDKTKVVRKKDPNLIPRECTPLTDLDSDLEKSIKFWKNMEKFFGG